jgi:hypothetical protein
MGSADSALDRVGGTTSRRLMPSRFMTQSGSSGKLVIWAWSRDGIVVESTVSGPQASRAARQRLNLKVGFSMLQHCWAA